MPAMEDQMLVEVVPPGEERISLFTSAVWQSSRSHDVKKYLQSNSVFVRALETATEYGNGNAISKMLMERIEQMQRDQKMLIVFVRDNHVNPLTIIDIFGKSMDGLITFEALYLSDVEVCVLHINDEGIWHALKNNYIHETTFNPSAANTYHVICTMNEFLDQYGDPAMTEEMLKDEWDPNHSGFALVYDNHPTKKKIVSVTKLDDTFPSFVRAILPDLPWSSEVSQAISQKPMVENYHFESNQSAQSTAKDIMTKFPNMPMKALWEALTSALFKGPEVPMAIANLCGMECRSKISEGDMMHNGITLKYGATPLILAVHAMRTDVVVIMVRAGADTRSQNVSGWSPLHVAVMHDDLEAANALLNPTSSNKNVSAAATYFQFESRPVNVNEADLRGNTPLHYARSNEMRRLLIDAGADIRALNRAINTLPDDEPGYGDEEES